MNSTRILCTLLALVVLLGAFASSAMAQPRPLTLSDSQEPGSVIVFPKFVRGLHAAGAVPGETGVIPKTEFELGVVCPKGQLCPEGQKVKIRAHYVCGSSQAQAATSFICKETDFDLLTTVNGKLVFNTEGVLPGNTISPKPQCDRGYLIAWVVDTSDRPIKFDGLIGDAVLRESVTSNAAPGTTSLADFQTSTAVAAYQAVAIQADPNLVSPALAPALITLGPNGELIFDGGAGHYLAVTGVVIGDVAYDRKASAPGAPAVGPRTSFLTLLTLDVLSNQPNLPTLVPFNFYNVNEFVLSTFT